jgi:alpha-mannosidase
MHHHLVVVPHTHWDREWYRTHEEFRYRLVRLLDGLLELLEADPTFRHFTLDGQTIVLDDYLGS